MRKVLFSGLVLFGLLASISVGAVRLVPAEYPSIQQAIDDCNDGDTVVVSPGVYYETINFGGRNILVTSKDPNDPKVVGYTIINADGDGTVVTFENRETAKAVLTGFTITGGVGTLVDQYEDVYQSYKWFYGAGIYCRDASPTITRNIIANNNGPYVEEQTGNFWRTVLCSGGGIACLSGSPTITYNTIRGNSAYDGGGIDVSGYAVVANNVICGNSAAYGGGVVIGQGFLLNNTIVGNDVSKEPQYGRGGNVRALFSSYYTDLIIANNVITGATSGGGLYVEQDVRGDVIRFNNVWDNAPANYGMTDPRTSESIYTDQADWTGRFGNISEDPLFLSPWNNNFHLQAGSPCISAGDPNAIPVQGTVDLDGDPRVYAIRVDIGADEYIGYVKPLANAGADQHVLNPEPIRLDGGASYFSDPCGVKTYQWSQTQGAAVELSDATVANPVFTPTSEGWYQFQLAVGDGQNTSKPDRVLVIIGNQTPVADAGPDKLWPLGGPVGLDGSRSHDADPPDQLSYSWTQVEGPSVTLYDANSATPSFFRTREDSRAGTYVFRLVVSDGFASSQPDTVKIEVAPFTLKAEPFVVPAAEQGGYSWYPAIAGVKVAYAGGYYTDATWAIQCVDMETGRIDKLMGGGTDTMPTMDGDIVVWSDGADDYYNPMCTSIYAGNIASGWMQFLRMNGTDDSYGYPAISGRKVVWLHHRGVDTDDIDRYEQSLYDICGADLTDFKKPIYFTIAEGAGRGVPYPYDAYGEARVDPVDICGTIVVWEGNGDIFGADISDPNHIKVFPVCTAPQRQYDPSISGNWVIWTDERNDAGDIYGADISNPNAIHEFEVWVGRGRQLQPDIDAPLIAFIDGGDYGGQIRTCCITKEYGILSFFVPMNRDVPISYYGVGPQVDGATIIWQEWNRIVGTHVEFAYASVNGPIQNVTAGAHYDYIQHAINAATDGDVIVVPQGTYPEKIRLRGRNVTVRSTDPDDPAVRAATILAGPGQRVTFADDETADCAFTGFTVADGSYGIFCGGATPTISNCTITNHAYAGIKLWNQSNPTFSRCEVLGNGRGVEMWANADKRIILRSSATFRNCLIAGSRGEGIYSGNLTLENCTIADNLGLGIDGFLVNMTNSIVYFNNQGAENVKVAKPQSAVTYSDVQGGWPGTGNIDRDPLFVAGGHWAAAAVGFGGLWVPGDYHLKSEGWTWDVGQQTWTSYDVTSPCIDAGDPSVPLGDEPVPEQGGPLSERAGANQRIDMGAYGGTAEASLAPR